MISNTSGFSAAKSAFVASPCRCRIKSVWAAIASVSLLSIVIGVVESSTAHADSFAIVAATGSHNNVSSTNRTLGWVFDVNQSIDVKRLGIWDDLSNGLLSSHQVGIWTNAGALLGSTTVKSGVGSPLDGATIEGGRFRYEPVSPIRLNAGSRYVIGGLFNNNDEFIYDGFSVTDAPQIDYITERFGNEGGGFVFPISTDNRVGLFGTNFTFDPVPEPTTFLLLSAAMMTMFGLRHRAHALNDQAARRC